MIIMFKIFNLTIPIFGYIYLLINYNSIKSINFVINDEYFYKLLKS